MLNKNFFMLLGLIIIIGFSIGFFTNGRKTSDVDNTDINAIHRDAEDILMLLTGAREGFNFEVSKALKDALADAGYTTALTVTGGTPESLAALLDGHGQLMITSSDKALAAYTGTGEYAEKEPARQLRVVVPLWENYWQVMVKANADINTLADLADKTIVAVGQNSTSDAAARALMSAAGPSFNAGQLVYAALPEAFTGLMQGDYDAVVWVAPPDAELLKSLCEADCTFKLLPISDDVYQRLQEKDPAGLRGGLPASAYGLSSDVPTVMTVSVLLTTTDMSENELYTLLKGLFSLRETSEEKYPLLEEVLFNQDHSVDIGVPRHAGNVRYFQEHADQ